MDSPLDQRQCHPSDSASQHSPMRQAQYHRDCKRWELRPHRWSCRKQKRKPECPSTAKSVLHANGYRDGNHSHEVPIWQLMDTRAFFFVSGMTIDADGAPNAYNPGDTGLDALANAGSPSHWDGIVSDREGNPFIQQETDPFPGYYV